MRIRGKTGTTTATSIMTALKTTLITEATIEKKYK